MTQIRSNYNSQTLDEYLNSVKRRVETGNAPPSGIFLELTHFARLYRTASEHPEPAEPGASVNQKSIDRQMHQLLQEIDTIRALVARSDGPEKNELLDKLEHLTVRLSNSTTAR
jgi:hypothetical protein